MTDISLMNNLNRVQTGYDRRKWLGIAAGTGALMAFPVWAGEGMSPPGRSAQPDLVRELSPEEKESAKSSRIVAQALQLRREGRYNCAELILLAAVKSFDLPEKAGETAAAFGGGVGHGELCGLLTGASMALGVLAFNGGGQRAEVKKRLKKWNDALWAWWKGVAPLDCRDLRPHYDKASFENLLIRTCLQVEQITLNSSGTASR
jgi:C_GCAxxG_C_C family probable redox protein